MTRKLALLLAACLGLWHGSAWALGLGEIEVRSALNERFSATIELRRIESLSQNEIIASLASADDFARLGVQRFFYLSELEFATDLSDRGRPRIRVTSNRPINEPFVNFVVDVRWPTGRMLREYTVLLDPPTQVARPTPALRPTETTPAARPAPTEVHTEPGVSPGAGRFDGDTYGVTDRNDTLWAIALEVRPSTAVSVQQTMLALQRLNPDAFIGGNINLLKAGYVLQVPSADEITRLSRQDAVVQVAEHNARWREGTPAMPVDARPAVAAGEQRSRPSGELRLIAGEDDDVRVTREASPAGAGDGAAMQALETDLAALQSRLSEAEAARRAAERQQQEAASELEEVGRQLELRNQELARLQRQLAQQQQAPATTSRAPAGGALGSDWMLLGGGLAGLILIVVAALLLLRRRRAQADHDVVAEADAPGGDQPIQQTQLMSAISKEDLARAGVVAGTAAGGSEGEGGDDESDVIAEADVYMAYGRFSEAARVLNSAIEADSQRADLRLKLMEVLVETQDVEAFNAQAEELRGFADEQTVALADDLASRLPGAITSTGATSQGESAGPTRAADEGEVSLDFDLGDDFGEPADLDSLDIDFDATSQSKAAAAPAAQADADDDDLTLVLDGDDGGSDDDAGLDLDLDIDAPKAAAESESDEVVDESDDELDLKFDFDEGDATLSDGEPATRDESAASADADDFDLDLPADDATPSAASAESADDELTLLDEDEKEEPAQSESSGIDPEFDLTMDGSGFVERPTLETSAEDSEDSGASDDLDDLEFDLAGGAGDAEATELMGGEEVAAPEPATSAAEEDDDADLNFDFDIEDLPAETEATAASPEEDLSATFTRAPDDDDDEDLTALSLEGFDDDEADDAGTAAPATSTAEELPVDLADDDLEFDMDFDEAGDETTTKLELARAYIDMVDEDGAKEILDEVVRDGSDAQQQEASELLAKLG